MDSPAKRFEALIEWLGISDTAVAKRLNCDPSYPRKIANGTREPGLDVAFAIERLSAEAREDGTSWPAGPLLAREWTRASSDTEAA